ncbi:MAG: hypothetical protein O2971_16805 [Proteobacteria bacterium]|nr:hypothetical protein [Pseudomonadota bacterium]
MNARPLTFAAQQRGVILLILSMLILMTGASVFINVMNNNLVEQRNSLDTARVLNDAKDTLISYAILHSDYYGAAGAGPGHLPCPDTNGDGVENTPCAFNALGRLPRSVVLPSTSVLPISTANDATDQQLWYALSNAFRRLPAGALNTTTAGTLTLDGQAGIAAVLIAPGEILGSQTRRNNTNSNYLEAGNAGGQNFVSNDAADPDNFNDRVLAISITEILSPVTARVAEAIKLELDNYHAVDGAYPDDTSFDDPLLVDYATALAAAPAWLANNGWIANSTYTKLSADTATVAFTGCGITYSLAESALSVTRTGAQC